MSNESKAFGRGCCIESFRGELQLGQSMPLNLRVH